MEIKYHYATVTVALEELKKMGYEYDYNLNEKELIMDPDGYIIHHIYRYEGNSNPDDQAIVYGINSFENKKGVYVAGYSANSEVESLKVIENLLVKNSNPK